MTNNLPVAGAIDSRTILRGATVSIRHLINMVQMSMRPAAAACISAVRPRAASSAFSVCDLGGPFVFGPRGGERGSDRENNRARTKIGY
jgi:hypothetical protein